MLAADPVISEFMAFNDGAILDEDGDAVDWIEIHNRGDEEVDLAGWHLTDEADEPTRWTFPSTVLGPDQYLLVFASNKDRAVSGQPLHTSFALDGAGEYLALVEPDGVTVAAGFAPDYPAQFDNVSYGLVAIPETTGVVGDGSPVRWKVPGDGTDGIQWTRADFDDDTWSLGESAIGFDDAGDYDGLFATDVRAEMFGNNASAYLRFPFDLDDPDDVDRLTLRMRYDDGFIAYLNGQEVAARNRSGELPTVNLAPLFGTASQSTTGFGGVPERGIDGNTDGQFSNGSVTHNNDSAEGAAGTTPYWQVDLGGAFPIETIVLHNRTDCCGGRFRDLTVDILDDDGSTVLFSSGLLNPDNVLDGGLNDHDNGPTSIEVDVQELAGGPVAGQTVRVTRTPGRTGGIGHQYTLSLAEVEVFGKSTFDVNVAGSGSIGVLEIDGEGTETVRSPLEDARLVRVRQNNSTIAPCCGSIGGFLTIGEMRTIEFGTGANVSLGATASASTDNVFGAYPAGHLNDDDVATFLHTAGSDGGPTNLGGDGVSRQQYADILLPAPTDLDSVVIVPRVNQNLIGDLTLQIFDDAAGTHMIHSQLFGSPGGSNPAVADVSASVAAGTKTGRLDAAAVYRLELDAATATADRIVLPRGVADETVMEIAGRLALSFVGGTPQVGQTFDLLEADTLNGSFTDVSLPALPQGLTFDLTDLSVDGTVRVVAGTPTDSDQQWNASASAERSHAQALLPESIDLTQYVSALSPGRNVLAVHGLNVLASDPDFLIAPQLLIGSFDQAALSPAYFTEPTPGGPNSSRAIGAGPDVRDVRHLPPAPSAGEPILVTAMVSESAFPIQSVRLHYRVMYGEETVVTMHDDGQHDDGEAGDGLFAARMPADAAPSGQMLRYYVSTSDSAGNEDRAPQPLDLQGTKQSAEYFGTLVGDTGTTTELPLLVWFTENEAAARGRAGTRASLYFDGQFYDNIFVRQRGGFTAGDSQKFVFNKTQPFDFDEQLRGLKEFNLNENGSDPAYVRQTLAFEAFRRAGVAAPESYLVLSHLNGRVDRVGIFIEQVDDVFLERNGYDPDGALYKFVQRSGSSTPTFGDISSGLEKKAPEDADFSDVQAVITGLNLPTAAERARYVFDNFDVPQLINYLAIRTLTLDIDSTRKNFYLYRDTNGSGEWSMFPWDKDWTFGVDPIGGTTRHPFLGDEQHKYASVQWSVLLDVFYELPETRTMYLRRLRTLMDELLLPPGTPAGGTELERRIDQIFDPAAPHLGSNVAAALQGVRDFFDSRRNDLYVVHGPGGTSDARIPVGQVANPLVEFGAVEVDPPGGLQDQEYIELVNPHDTAVDVSGWRLDGGVRYTFQPGTVIPARGSLYVSPNVAQFRARQSDPRGGRGLFVQGDYEGHISSFGETIELIGADGAIVASIDTPVQVNDLQQYLRITELMYNPPDPTPDELQVDPALDNDDFEFLELKNVGDGDLDLSAVRFAAGDPVDFVFAGGTLLAPGELLVLVSNPTAFEARYGVVPAVAGVYAGNLSNSGERFLLLDPSGSQILDFEYDDSGDWPERADGNGSSLSIVDPAGDVEDPGNWRASVEFGGSPGRENAQPAADIVINEVLSHTDPPQVDSIELMNVTDQPIDVGGWLLSDTDEPYRKFEIPSPTVIPPQGYVVFDEFHFNPDPANPGPLHFALNGAHGDDVWLLGTTPTGELSRFVDHARFGAQANGQSWGRWPNGVGALYPSLATSLGAENVGPAVGQVVFSEIMYHPAEFDVPEGVDAGDLEYVELHNPTASPVDLTAWVISGGIDYEFPVGTTIGAGQHLLLVALNPSDTANEAWLAAFRELYAVDAGVAMLGGYSGRLSNAGEVLDLSRPDEPPDDEPEFRPRLLEDQVSYGDREPWDPAADGGGLSLTRIDATAWGNDPSGWFAAPPTPGHSDQGPLVVERTIVNGGIEDPADRPAAAQPTSWLAQRSDIRRLIVEFNRPVMADASSVRLTNLGVSAPSDPDQPVVIRQDQISSDGRRLVLDFSTQDLGEGVYRLEILGTLTDLQGRALDGDNDGTAGGDYVRTGDDRNGLYELSSDFNQDFGVSIFDFSTFAYWFGLPVPAAPAYVDLDGDSGVSIFDFTIFARDFGRSVTFPTPLAPIASAQLEPARGEEQPAPREAMPAFAEQRRDLEPTPIDRDRYAGVGRRSGADRSTAFDVALTELEDELSIEWCW